MTYVSTHYDSNWAYDADHADARTCGLADSQRTEILYIRTPRVQERTVARQTNCQSKSLTR